MLRYQPSHPYPWWWPCTVIARRLEKAGGDPTSQHTWLSQICEDSHVNPKSVWILVRGSIVNNHTTMIMTIFMMKYSFSVAESAPASPSSRVDASQQNSGDLSEHSTGRLTVDYPILPVLSSSAPEREGLWHEVKRKSTERLKITIPKDLTPNQSVEVCSAVISTSHLIFYDCIAGSLR